MASPSKTVRKKPNPQLILRRRDWQSTRRSLLAGALMASAVLGCFPAAAAPGQSGIHGSTAGLLTPAPVWSLGAQVGNYGGTGLSAQRLAVPGGGAVNLSVGIEAGTIGVNGDYIFFASDQFHLLQLKANGDYNVLRGQLLLYFGGGLGLQHGAWVRVPIGVQYTMLRDPCTFYGGFALALGPFLSDHGLGPEAWLSFGMRLLL